MLRRGARVTVDSIGVRVAVCDSPLDWAWASPATTLHRSSADLPPLPVPPLDETLAAYVLSVRPFTGATAQLQTDTETHVARFAAGLGPVLQARLVERATQKRFEGTSWLAEFWDDLAYGTWRGSLPFTVSYFYALRDDPQRPTQLSRAAGITVEMARAAFAFQSGAQPQETVGKADTPLCSNGFKYLFNSARVPQPYKDATRCFDPADPRCATVAISRRGQLFTLSILRDATAAEPLCASNILSAAEIEARLRAVIRSAGSSSGSGAAPSLGLLSAVERDEWLQSRNAMLRVGENCAAFDAIDRSLFLLCLDEQSPVTASEVNRMTLLDSKACQNRYWDKTMQVVVFGNGKASFIGEHSRCDGMPTTHLLVGVLDKMWEPESAPNSAERAAAEAQFQLEGGGGGGGVCEYQDDGGNERGEGGGGGSEGAEVAEVELPRPVRLPFTYDGAAMRALDRAEVFVASTAAAHGNAATRFQGFGRTVIKQLEISPDAFAQLSLALAYRRMHGESAATYESVQVRRYQHGRTACARSSTHASQDFCVAMDDPAVPRSTAVALFRRAATEHVRIVRAASAAHGIDRHLLGLQCVATPEELASREAMIFKDPIFMKSSTWVLSTSMLVSEHFVGSGYGQVTDAGYGSAYVYFDITSETHFFRPYDD